MVYKSMKPDNLVIIGLDFWFWNPHFVENLPVQNVDRAALIHQDLGDGKFIDLYGDDHGVVLS